MPSSAPTGTTDDATEMAQGSSQEAASLARERGLRQLSATRLLGRRRNPPPKHYQSSIWRAACSQALTPEQGVAATENILTGLTTDIQPGDPKLRAHCSFETSPECGPAPTPNARTSRAGPTKVAPSAGSSQSPRHAAAVVRRPRSGVPRTARTAVTCCSADSSRQDPPRSSALGRCPPAG